MKETQSMDDTYEILNQIGRGSYASVYKAINRETGEIFAIKRIPSNTSHLHNLITEIQIISTASCENIVKFFGSDYHNKEVHIVMEYCCGGSVKDVMRQLDRNINQEQIYVILKDVLNGLDYLHTKNKIHRDVKSANILLNQDGVAKLGDFGVSEPVNTSHRVETMVGTYLWIPPEVINKDRNYTTAIDIWSLGITIIEMGDGEPPFQNMDLGEAMREIADMSKASPSFKNISKWSQGLVDFLDSCLDKDASKRKNAKELLEHQIIKEAPSRVVIKNLVDEVCSKNNRTLELESGLSKEIECLLNESSTRYKIYKKRVMKVIRVDQMTDRLVSAQEEFKDLQNKWVLRNSRIRDMRAQLKCVLEENQRLLREKNDLQVTLNDDKVQCAKIREQLEIIRDKIT